MSREIMINELEYCITTKILSPFYTPRKNFFCVFSAVYFIWLGIEASINGNVDLFLSIIGKFEWTFEMIIGYVNTD